MVANISLAPSLGFSSYPENLGKIENKGWEISLSAIPYKNTAKQAYWTITVNGSHNTDKLLKISEAMKYRNDKSASDLKDTPLPRYEEGESLSRIWVVRSLGIDPASGDEILLKRNGEMTSAVNWSANDVVPIGNTEPNGKDILILPLHTEVGEQMSASGISLAVRYIIRPCLTRWKMLI